MDFEPDAEERLLADTARRFAEDGGDRAGFFALGLAGAALAEDAGGYGLGLRGAVLVQEALGRAARPLAYGSVTVPGLALLASAGDAAPAGLVARAIEGEARLALDLGGEGAPRLSAHPEAGGWRLEGCCPLVEEASDATDLIAAAHMPDGTTGLFLLQSDTVEITPLPAADGRSLGRIAFAGQASGTPLHLPASALANAAAARLCGHAADTVGAMETLLAFTAEHLRTRHQFRQPLGSFQVLRHRFAEMGILHREARVLTLAAAMALDEGVPEGPRLASMAWVQAARAARVIAEETVQMHGALGMTAEAATSPFVLRLMVTRALAGCPEAHLDRLACT